MRLHELLHDLNVPTWESDVPVHVLDTGSGVAYEVVKVKTETDQDGAATVWLLIEEA